MMIPARKWAMYYVWIVTIVFFAVWQVIDYDSDTTFYHDMRLHHEGADDVYDRVMEFMDTGERFTAEDGRVLSERVQVLEDIEFTEHGVEE